MQVCTKIDQIISKNTAVTVGNFDGLHLGHQHLLVHLVSEAKTRSLVPTVVIFEPQPLEVFLPDKAPARLLTLDEKTEQLEKLGVECVVVLPFSLEMAKQTAQAFIDDFLVKKLGTQYLLTGRDFHFGANREGNVAYLREHAPFEIAVFDDHAVNEARVSSTLVREALARGDFAQAKAMLGRAYTMQGEVVRGQQLGRKLGCPTANIAPNRLVCPLRGIYVTRVYGLPESPLMGAASIGVRPAVEGEGEWLEVHLLDFDRDIYGKHLIVEFLHKLRDEEHFKSLEALKTQMAQDVADTRAYFEAEHE
ncbi:MAG: bifunctional riboflavin kinase/FMN adenylyltransferase [Gammaproteobacteria bacterium CG11_big_fil_rev_8_21_14_0_20_46_22]|nr:MAG: bifunctional riboflavin kinase/FMN adenylyltransferase [Gammaproteobacteria bacterium CG12_big_fil_rev_8_21_14_0_65_46_12]PIR11909.1 MAG: bifunctional riboflavin kinase/FMN adenylyltransferase [Gammaproteobacteria bacterium CG11_big_fil_rev_8_21_14_0_20_46_22]